MVSALPRMENQRQEDNINGYRTGWICSRVRINIFENPSVTQIEVLEWSYINGLIKIWKM